MTAASPASLPEVPPSRLALVLAFAVIYLVWGSTYLGIRVAVTTMPPFAMAAARFFFAGFLLFVWLRLRGVAWPTARQCRDNFIVGTFLLLGGNGLVAWASQYVPSGIIALIIGVSPIFMVMTEWAWPGGVRPTAATFFALLLGTAGVGFLTSGGTAAGLPELPGPALLAIFGGCLCWSVGSIYSRHTRQAASPPMSAALQMLGGSLSLIVVAALTGDWGRLDLGAISPASWVAFVYLTLIGSILAFSTFVWLLKNTTPARLSTHTYINPVVAVVLGWLILAEPITPRTMIAAAIIVSAVVIVTLQKNRPAPPTVSTDA